MKAGKTLDEADEQGTADGQVLGVVSPAPLDRTLAPEQTVASNVGQASTETSAGGDASLVHFAPGSLKIEHVVKRGLDLGAEAFGAVRNDYDFTTVTVTLVDGAPRVDATLLVTQRWDVQPRGSMQQSLDLVSNDPETLAPEFESYTVGQVMAAALRPDANNMPGFVPYWDEAEAIAHEQVHIKDEQEWAASAGQEVLAKGWALAAFEAPGGELDPALVAEKAQLWAPAVAAHQEIASNKHYFGGESDPGYATRAGEVRAYTERAPHLRAIADAIEAKAKSLSGGQGQGAITLGGDKGGSEGPALMGNEIEVTTKLLPIVEEKTKLDIKLHEAKDELVEAPIEVQSDKVEAPKLQDKSEQSVVAAKDEAKVVDSSRSNKIKADLEVLELRATPIQRRVELVRGVSGKSAEALASYSETFTKLKAAMIADYEAIKIEEAAAGTEDDAQKLAKLKAKVADLDAQKTKLDAEADAKMAALDASPQKAEEATTSAALTTKLEKLEVDVLRVLAGYEATVAALPGYFDGLGADGFRWFGDASQDPNTRIKAVLALGMGQLSLSSEQLDRLVEARLMASSSGGSIVAANHSQQLVDQAARREALWAITPDKHASKLAAALKQVDATLPWMTELEALVELVNAQASLKEILLKQLQAALGSETIVAAQVGPEAAFATAIDAAASGPEKLDVVRAYVVKWAKSPGVLMDANDSAVVAKALAKLEPLDHTIAIEMLLSGKPQHRFANADGGAKEMGLELVLMSQAPDQATLGAAKERVAARIDAFYRKLKDYKAQNPGKALLPEDKALLDAFVARVAKSEPVTSFVKRELPQFFSDAFLPLVGFHVHDVPTKDDKSEPAEAVANDTVVDTKSMADHAKLAEEIVEHLKAVDLAWIETCVGKPATPVKVTFMLDRYEEACGVSYWSGADFDKLSAEQRLAIRDALGMQSEQAYSAELTQLMAEIEALAAIDVEEGPLTVEFNSGIAELQRALEAGFVTAKALFAKLDVAQPGHDERVAPNGRLPATAQMVLLNAFDNVVGSDLAAYLRHALNSKGKKLAWQAEWDFGLLANTVRDIFAIEIRALLGVGEAEAGLAVAMIDETADKLLGPGQERFVKPGMKLPPGFDDNAALRAADNIHAVMDADMKNMAFHQDAALAKAKLASGELVAPSILSGALAPLMSVMSWETRVEMVLVSLRAMPLDTRAVIDAAFQARFGRTLLAECARYEAASRLEDYVGRDDKDPNAYYVTLATDLANAGNADKLLDLAGEMPRAAGQQITADPKLMATLRETLGKEMATFEQLLAGGGSPGELLSKLIAKRDGIFKDDVAGTTTDATRVLKMVARDLLERYPGAKDTKHAAAAAHTEAYAAELRKAAIELAFDVKFVATAVYKRLGGLLGFMKEEQLKGLQALILEGGKAAAVGTLLERYRTTTYFKQFDKAKFASELGAMSAEDRALVAKDQEIRRIIATTLSDKQQRDCLALLDGDAASTLQIIADKPAWWSLRGLEPTALFEAIEAYDFTVWSQVRTDSALVKELMGKLTSNDKLKLSGILRLSGDGRASADATPQSTSARDLNRAKVVFERERWRRKLLNACHTGQPGTLLEAALAMYQAKGSIVSDTPESDKLAKKAADDLLSWNEPASDDKAAVTVSVREQVASDSGLTQAMDVALGKLDKTYEAVVRDAILKTVDPSTALFAYYSGNHDKDKPAESGGDLSKAYKSLEGDATKLIETIKLASADTFIVDFTDVMQQVPALLAYQNAKAKQDASAATQLDSLQRVRFGPSPWVLKMIAAATVTAEKTQIEEAVKARIVTLLGSTELAKITEPSLVMKLMKERGVAFETLSDAYGFNLEAQVQIDKATEKTKEHGTEAMGDNAAHAANLVNTAKVLDGTVTKDVSEKVGAVVGNIDEEVKAIEAKAEKLFEWGKAGAEWLLPIVVAAVTPGAGLFAVLVPKVLTLLASQAMTKDLLKNGLDGYLKSVMQEGIKQVVGWVATEHLTKALPLFEGGKLVKSVNFAPFSDKVNEALRGKVEAQIGAGIASLGDLASDLKVLRVFRERGFDAYMRGLVGALGRTDVEAMVLTALDGVGASVLTGLKDELKEVLDGYADAAMELMYGKDEEEETPVIDSELTTREGLELWSGGKGVVELLGAAVSDLKAKGFTALVKGMPTALGGDTDFKAFHKAWAKYAIDGGLERVTTVLADLPKLIEDPRGYLDASVFATLSLVEGKLDLQQLPAAAWEWTVARAVATGTGLSDAFGACWKRYGLANDLKAAGETDPTVLDAVFDSKDQSRGHVVKAFLAGRATDATLTHEGFLARFDALEAELNAGIDPKYRQAARLEIAKAASSGGIDLTTGTTAKQRGEVRAAVAKKITALKDASAKKSEVPK